MTTTTPPAPAVAMTPAEARRRKRRALGAAGLILGLGAMITLATWTDQEFLGIDFESARFALEGNIEGSVDNSEWGQHDSAAAAAQLQFDLPEDGVMPGQSVAAPFWVRLTAETVQEAELVATDITAGGDNLDHYSYTIYHSVSSCSVATTGSVLGSGATLNSADLLAGSGPVLQPSPTVSEPGEAVQLCVVLTAGEVNGDAGFQPGVNTTITWGLTATADSDEDES